MLLLSLSMAIWFIGSGMTLAGLLLGKKWAKDREKNSPFECGFDPLGSSRLHFSLRFYIIAVVFVVFDVEIALLLPLVVSSGETGSEVWALLCMSFLILLLGGVYYEWWEGSLNWIY